MQLTLHIWFLKSFVLRLSLKGPEKIIILIGFITAFDTQGFYQTRQAPGGETLMFLLSKQRQIHSSMFTILGALQSEGTVNTVISNFPAPRGTGWTSDFQKYLFAKYKMSLFPGILRTAVSWLWSTLSPLSPYILHHTLEWQLRIMQKGFPFSMK